jgi:hypothetical protein
MFAGRVENQYLVGAFSSSGHADDPSARPGSRRRRAEPPGPWSGRRPPSRAWRRIYRRTHRSPLRRPRGSTLRKSLGAFMLTWTERATLFSTLAVCRVGRWRGGGRAQGLAVGRRLSPRAGASVSPIAPSPASPHRTVRDVFRHTALREPSPGGLQHRCAMRPSKV